MVFSAVPMLAAFSNFKEDTRQRRFWEQMTLFRAILCSERFTFLGALREWAQLIWATLVGPKLPAHPSD